MPTDPYAKRLLWFVFMGSKGGLNRIRLVSIIRNTPLNANQIAKEMGLDYKAIQHHIGVLEKNNMITRVGDKYGATFFISTSMQIALRPCHRKTKIDDSCPISTARPEDQTVSYTNANKALCHLVLNSSFVVF